MAREYQVETPLKKAIEASGGVCEKHVNTGYRGDPDRLCSWPWGYHCLAETKWATGVKPEPHQLRRHEHYRAHGMDVWVVCDRHDIDNLVAYALGTKTIPANSRTFSVGPSTGYVSCGPRPGENGNRLVNVRYLEDGRFEFLPCLGPGPKAGS